MEWKQGYAEVVIARMHKQCKYPKKSKCSTEYEVPRAELTAVTELPEGWRPAPAKHCEQSNNTRVIFNYPGRVRSEPLPKNPEIVSALLAYANWFQLGLELSLVAGGSEKEKCNL